MLLVPNCYGQFSPSHSACWLYCCSAAKAASFLSLLLFLFFFFIYQFNKGGQDHSRKSLYWGLMLSHYEGNKKYISQLLTK
jgi:hypothetical protein